MASFLNKAKDKIEAALNQDSSKGGNTQSGHHGTHSSNVANTADSRIDSDRDGRNDPTSRAGGYGQTQGHDQYGHTQGAGGLTSSDTYGSNTNNPGYDNTRSTNTGTHGSNVLNKADPRVDSDRDNRIDSSSRIGGVGHTQQYGDSYGQTGGAGGLATSDTSYGHTGTGIGAGSHGYSGTGTGYDNTSSTTAPHKSNLANKLDPRVDQTTGTHSTGTHGAAPIHHTTTHSGSGVDSGVYTGGLGGTGDYDNSRSSGLGRSGDYDSSRSSTTGPHNNNLLNKADPRVDSDRDHRNDPTSRVGGYGTQGENYGHSSGIGGHSTTGTTGGYGAGTTTEGYGAGTTTGGYGSGRTGGDYETGRTGDYELGRNTGGYESGRTGEGYGAGHNTGHTTGHTTTSHGSKHNTEGYGGNSDTPGSGSAPNTAGPYSSDIMNKLDPRVDSDLDGSKTYGGNKTHS